MAARIVDRTIQKFGKVNILINSAGIIKGGGIESLNLTEYEHQMDVNVKSNVNLTQKCVPHLMWYAKP